MIIERNLKDSLKCAAMKLVKVLVYYSGAYIILDRVFRQKCIYIMMYHRLDGYHNEKSVPEYSIKVRNFEKQIRYYKKI